MSTIEDFKNAPIGSTATRKATMIRAMKTGDSDRYWMTPFGSYLSDEEMERWGYTLDAPAPAPTTAQESLDLAWELSHPVKEGQHIPSGTRLLDRLDRNEFSVYTALVGFTIISARESLNIRTLAPLSDPEPDWLDAPAVLAACAVCADREFEADDGLQITIHGPIFDGQKWECTECQTVTVWPELMDVTPLYPKEVQEA